MRLAAWILVVLPVVMAQPPKLAFEVATVKLNVSGSRDTRVSGIGPGPGGGRFSAQNIPLRQLIILAYADSSQGPVAPGGPGLPISGGPGWVSIDRFDIDARPEAGFVPTVEQSQRMLTSRRWWAGRIRGRLRRVAQTRLREG